MVPIDVADDVERNAIEKHATIASKTIRRALREMVFILSGKLSRVPFEGLLGFMLDSLYAEWETANVIGIVYMAPGLKEVSLTAMADCSSSTD